MFNIEFLTAVRAEELKVVIGLLKPRTRLLEIGAGMGWQARELTMLGHEVEAVDLPTSEYSAHRVFPVTDYNGTNLPFPDETFDIVYTSNVLEHVLQLDVLQAEIKRVLKPQGRCIHILPTATWRLWTSIAAFPNAVVTMFCELLSPGKPQALRRIVVATGLAILHPAHGVGWHAITELWTFRPSWWRHYFMRHGFHIQQDRPIELFYTGFFLLGNRLTLARRRSLARIFGGACHTYVLENPAH